MEAKKLVISTDVRDNFERSAAAVFGSVSCLPPAEVIPYNNDYVTVTIELLEDRTTSTAYLSTCRTQKGAIFFAFISLCEKSNNRPQIVRQFINAQEYNDYCMHQLKDNAREHPQAIL